MLEATPPVNDVNDAGLTDSVDDAPVCVDFWHCVHYTRDVLDRQNPVLRQVMGRSPQGTGRTLVIVDDGVAAAWPDLPERLRAYAAATDAMEIIGEISVVTGGEAAKNDWRVFEQATRAIHDAQLCRRSTVIAIGGGAVLDTVGFAAATAHRGVRLVRLPTTTLAQGDAGIGVKNGINAFGKKNFLGVFTPPWAVINDEGFLETLSDRDWRAGMVEAIKVALLKDAAFFSRLRHDAPRLRERDVDAGRRAVRRSGQLHFEHITREGDPYELRTARPLDFGHWSGHKLEQLTEFTLRHGEAVAIGIALDVLYAKAIGLLDGRDAEVILDCMRTIGFRLYDEALTDRHAVLEGLEEFREHLGGKLTITLLEGIGRPIDVHEIDRGKMRDAMETLAAEG